MVQIHTNQINAFLDIINYNTKRILIQRRSRLTCLSLLMKCHLRSFVTQEALAQHNIRLREIESGVSN